MKQLLVLSGKGGTGKTTVSGAFISLSKAKAYADCDVDAPNLHLIVNKTYKPLVKDYYGMPKAGIDSDLCLSCGLCMNTCRFDAISNKEGFSIDLFSCEGCGVCELVCPAFAISMKPDIAGELVLYKDDESVFSTAELKMGSGTSGMLVSEVKKQMKQEAYDCDLSIIDGSPGIGCPVIASISGVDMVLIVTEPSLSGISDMERILKTIEIFKTKVAVCVNKYDSNLEICKEIEDYCNKKEIEFVGKIPYDSEAYKATNKGISLVDVECVAGIALSAVYHKTMDILKKEK